MASITIRNLDADLKARLRAAENHCPMEEEARRILRDAFGRKPRSRNVASIVRSHFGRRNGMDLALLPRDPLSFD